MVGKVYVIDKDVNDFCIYEVFMKSFEYFIVVWMIGMISSSVNLLKGDYFFMIKVFDFNSLFLEVVCFVFIKVKEVIVEVV